jgi:hypothetical protein
VEVPLDPEADNLAVAIQSTVIGIVYVDVLHILVILQIKDELHFSLP